MVTVDKTTQRISIILIIQTPKFVIIKNKTAPETPVNLVISDELKYLI